MFCGSVEKVIMDVYVHSLSLLLFVFTIIIYLLLCYHSDPNTGVEAKQFAVVVFENSNAFSTALLLGNATIVDSSIVVYPYSKILQVAFPSMAVSSLIQDGASNIINNNNQQQSQQQQQALSQQANDAQNLQPHATSAAASSQQQGAATPSQYPAVAVIASLAAQGYLKGEEILKQMKKQAHDLDQQHHLTQKVKIGVQVSREKAAEIDQSLRLTQRLQNFREDAQQGVAFVGGELDKVKGDIARSLVEFDQKYQLQQHASHAKQVTSKVVNDMANIVMENDVVKQSKQYLEGALSYGWNALVSGVNMFQQDVQQQQQQQQQPRRNVEMKSQQKPQATPTKQAAPAQQQQKPQQQAQAKPKGSEATIDNFIQFEDDAAPTVEPVAVAAPAPAKPLPPTPQQKQPATVQQQPAVVQQRPVSLPPVEDNLLSFEPVPQKKSDLLSFD